MKFRAMDSVQVWQALTGLASACLLYLANLTHSQRKEIARLNAELLKQGKEHAQRYEEMYKKDLEERSKLNNTLTLLNSTVQGTNQLIQAK